MKLYKFKPILKTITSDNGKEFFRHQAIAKELGKSIITLQDLIKVEKEDHENLNGLIR